ncbi:MAG: hypothetical protein CSA79_05945 [Thiothrix nivea]|nr:MAG: hypothetical protein CSA79_05945 [Thiothrix nivea]
MRIRMITLLCTTLLLAACDAGLGITDPQNDDSTRLDFKMIKFQQQGGPDCPELVADMNVKEAGADDQGAATAENTQNHLCATVTFSYPQLSSDAKPELAEKLNRFILQQMVDNPAGSADATTTPQQLAEAFIDEYRQTPNPFNSWELERNLKIVFVTQDMLTLLFEEYGYTGGAHPFSGRRYSVLSLKDASQIILPDLLNPGYETALNVAAERIFRQVRRLKEEETLEEQGFSFPNDVFAVNDNFGVLKEGLDFIFNPYEIAPYALGPTQFLVPYEDIQELIRPDGPLGRSANQSREQK